MFSVINVMIHDQGGSASLRDDSHKSNWYVTRLDLKKRNKYFWRDRCPRKRLAKFCRSQARLKHNKIGPWRDMTPKNEFNILGVIIEVLMSQGCASHKKDSREKNWNLTRRDHKKNYKIGHKYPHTQQGRCSGSEERRTQNQNWYSTRRDRKKRTNIFGVINVLIDDEGGAAGLFGVALADLPDGSVSPE